MRACISTNSICTLESKIHVAIRHWMTKQPTTARAPKTSSLVRARPREMVKVCGWSACAVNWGCSFTYVQSDLSLVRGLIMCRRWRGCAWRHDICVVGIKRTRGPADVPPNRHSRKVQGARKVRPARMLTRDMTMSLDSVARAAARCALRVVMGQRQGEHCVAHNYKLRLFPIT